MAPELLFEIDELIIEETNDKTVSQDIISIELIEKIVKWDRKNKRLKDYEFIFMSELASGKKPLTPQTQKIAYWNLQKVKKYGFCE